MPGLLNICASNRATLVLLVVLTAAITIYYQVSLPGRLWIIVLPTLLLIGNFVLALLIRGILKNNWPLMVFHFALIALVALVFLGQMTYFQGTLELAQNESFDGDPGQIANIRQGPWHRFGLTDARFSNQGFRINYREGIKRDRTVNSIAVISRDGSQHPVEIGDHVPLVIGHYRFYTTFNKGYAPLFEWYPSGQAEPVIGTIHLPSYPLNEFSQALEWELPGSDQNIWTLLRFDDELLPEDRAFEFQIPQRNWLVVRFREQRHELRPGEQLTLPGGMLRYRELTTWMGYKIDYDWTRPWLLATVIIGLLALFTHYLVKFSLIGAGKSAGMGLPGADLPNGSG